MYDSMWTFKTRRRHPRLLLLACLLVTIFNDVASMAMMPISCPEPCECYLNYNGEQSARCSEIYTNQTAFPNIHVLVMRMNKNQNQCEIPKDIHLILPELSYVYMMNCSLVYLPVDTFKDLQSLQEIDLSNNYMKKLDPSLFINNHKLIYVSLANNPLHIYDRPLLISKSITDLDLISCGIREIPDNMFKNLTRVVRLNLNDNLIVSIDEDTLPSGLKKVLLKNNRISRIPVMELERLKKIRIVDLSENPINCTCDEMNFVEVFSGKPVIFDNDIQCYYPRQYRGWSINKIPEQICYDQIGEGVDLPEGDPGDDEDDYSDPRTNQIIPEAKPTKKKDEVQEDFERDQVVPVDKKIHADYNKDEMQSDSISDEGSGDGTEIPEPSPGSASKDEDDDKPTNNKSDNNENNDTKPDDMSPQPPKQERTSQSTDITPEKKSDVESYEHELTTKNEKSEDKVESKGSESATNPSITSESENPKENEPVTESKSPEPKEPDSETVSESSTPESPDSKSEPPATDLVDTNVKATSVEPTIQETQKTVDASPSSEITIPTTENTTSAENKTSADGSAVSNAQLQNINSTSESSMFNYGYIIPCLAIIIVIIICLGIYLGQRSSHKNWEPANTNTNNDGAELQNVSLLPDRSKMPIVKNKKYPTEGNSEQTERLMNDGDPSTPKSAWEHGEEPKENGNSKHATDTQLPNGQSIDKNEPIECAIAKVTTLPDSIPRTPLIRNT